MTKIKVYHYNDQHEIIDVYLGDAHFVTLDGAIECDSGLALIRGLATVYDLPLEEKHVDWHPPA